MKKFFFPLDTVLRYKEQVLDSLKGEHARILAKIRECENAIDELEHEYSQCAAEFQQNKMNGMKINEMHTYENYFDSLRLKIRRKQEQLARLREQEEIKRKEVVEAKKETSSIDKLKERDGIEIDNVTQAMDRLVADGVKEVVIQPTHVMSGFEYDDIVKEVSPYQEKFDSFKMGSPLLITDEDYQELASVIAEETKEYDTDGSAVVFMGHGTEHEANAAYARLQKVLTEGGYSRYFIGTVEAEPSLEDVLALVQASGAKKVTLLPLMIVAGDHANNDMAGDEDDSWKSVFEKAGFEVECVLKGLGQYPGIQKMFVDHVAKTISE